MSQLVAFYEQQPIPLKARVEIQQEPVAAGARSTDDAIRPAPEPDDYEAWRDL